MKITREINERFWSKVDKRGIDDCWLWTGKLHRGYSSFTVRTGQTLTARRFAWCLFNPEPPQGYEVFNTCPNKHCVNPRHLALRTREEHLEKTRSFKKPPLIGRLPEQIPGWVNEIRRRYALGGITQEQLAKEYGISRQAVNTILRHKSYKLRK